MLAVLLVVVAQAAPPKGLGLRELQERARKNDPRAMQVAAQLEAARGKRDEASWVFFPAFQTTAYLAGPTPQRRLIGGDLDPDPTNPAHLKPGSTGGIFHGDQGVTAHVDVQAVMPIWTFGKWTAGKSAAGHLVNASEALLQRARDQAAYDVARAYWGYQTARNADASVQKVRTRLKDAQQTAQKLLAEKSEQISRADSMKLDYLAEEVEAQHASAVKNRDLALTGLRLLVGAQAGEDLPILEQELQQALGDLADARVRVERYGNETQIGKQLSNQAGVAFDSGLGDARELLEGTLLFMRADGERLRALHDAQLAWAALEKAAGAPLGP